jgi:hypothetical protein
MRRFGLVLLVAITAALSARVGSAGEGDTLITDPALLTRLGFPPDARNVYLAKGAVLDQKSSLAAPEEFGTEDFGWTTVLGNQHHPADPASVDGMMPESIDGGLYYGPGAKSVDAQLHMPSGAFLRQVAWFVYDVSDANFATQVRRICQTGVPPGQPQVTILGGGTSATTFANSVIVLDIPAGEEVQNVTCAYFARTTFLLGGDHGEFLILRKVRAGWQRQVSLAPLSATFPNDTPTTHPYFRFIEALAASGITAGCAPGFFCPNNPITRGEMAVFLAVALGLHSVN